jgi:glycosyltransferase involved in cell wall biosynthesis
LFTPGNADELAAAILALVRDPARRAALGTAARAHAMAHFDPAVVVRQTLAVYQQDA